jgi:hypothetical protein
MGRVPFEGSYDREVRGAVLAEPAYGMVSGTIYFFLFAVEPAGKDLSGIPSDATIFESDLRPSRNQANSSQQARSIPPFTQESRRPDDPRRGAGRRGHASASRES